MGGLIDRYMEVSMGHGMVKSVRPKSKSAKTKMTTRQYKDYEIILYLRCVSKFLKKIQCDNHNDLISIKDEMIEAITQAIYLFNTR
jgi:hypothetical protein